MIAWVVETLRHDGTADERYRSVRRRLGRSILLGLEFLVAGDIVRSVVVSPSFRSVGILAIIVVIRSFLSTTLEMEISGTLPWRRDDTPGSAQASGT